MIPDMIHTPYIAPRISVMAPPPVTAERFVDELLSGLCMPDGGFVAHLAPSGDPFSNGWNAAMKLQASQPASRRLPMPVNVIFHNPATIVFWDDGDKTVVKCQPGDTFSAEAGLTAAILSTRSSTSGWLVPAMPAPLPCRRPQSNQWTVSSCCFWLWC